MVTLKRDDISLGLDAPGMQVDFTVVLDRYYNLLPLTCCAHGTGVLWDETCSADDQVVPEVECRYQVL